MSRDTQHTGGIIGAVAQAFHAANDLPPGLRDRLIRLGYLQIDAGGLFGGDRYASAEDVAEVRDDVVRLGVGGADLVG